ncbi:MAG TPA: DCC1-like thiol-disulfide oxidoreductase family protein [Blastocatellia bacterium]|nr:DCC1-like thiol-disulfide oxidoreductase family protein [Blastocatellia bacterium]
MIEDRSFDYLLFDGDCGVCTHVAGKIKERDSAGRIKALAYRTVPEDELIHSGTDYSKCSKRVYVISRKGRVYGGVFAINYLLLLRFPWSMAAVIIYVIPVFLVLEAIGYAVFAKNRHRVSAWLGMNACVAGEPRK